jgi:hypothetical protein
MSDTFLPDGTVLSSSQFDHPEIGEDQRVSTPMLGIVLAVNPSDDPNNLTATATDDDRGWRHECSVLIVDNNGEPNLILENVSLPPGSHSGVDNFDEDLPRGLGQSLLTGKKVPEDFKGIDFNELNAEWCVLNYIGGAIDKPFVQNWYNHPRNTFDPATSGNACLTQVDLAKNKFRKFRRINGVNLVVNQNGDVYLNTAEANSKVDISSGNPVRTKYDKGGSVQVDIKSSQQMEFNWNTPVEGLAAGSNSQTQSRDPSLPHVKHREGTPEARGTSRTLLRFKEYEAYVKTSSLNINCATEGSTNGEFVALGENMITLMQGDSTVGSVTLHNGAIQAISSDGSLLEIAQDTASLATSSGATVSITPGGAVNVSGTSVVVSAPCTVGGPTAVPLVKAAAFTGVASLLADAELELAEANITQFTTLAGACTSPPLSSLASGFTGLADAWTAYKVALEAYKQSLTIPLYFTTGLTSV